jgi:hypothetical protein
MEALEAELQAIDLWDRLFVESQQPAKIEKDATNARFFRRLQIILRMEGLAGSQGARHGILRVEKSGCRAMALWACGCLRTRHKLRIAEYHRPT